MRESSDLGARIGAFTPSARSLHQTRIQYSVPDITVDAKVATWMMLCQTCAVAFRPKYLGFFGTLLYLMCLCS